MSSVFVSYSRESEAVVARLAADIEALGHDAWFDQDLSGGQVWWAQILQKIRETDIFVFALSPKAVESVACKREYDYAEKLGKPILPIMVADGVSPDLLSPALAAIQIVDYRSQDRDAALRLARAIRVTPPPRPLPDPLPPSPDVPVSYLGSLRARIEAPGGLDFAEQSALLVELHRVLREPDTRSAALNLVARFTKRHDLLASIAKELDQVAEETSHGLPERPEPDLRLQVEALTARKHHAKALELLRAEDSDAIDTAERDRLRAQVERDAERLSKEFRGRLVAAVGEESLGANVLSKFDGLLEANPWFLLVPTEEQIGQREAPAGGVAESRSGRCAG